MENSSLPIRCDCLQDGTTDLLEDRLVQVAHIDERVVQLDHHMQQLIELRSTLLHRSNQLRSPFYMIPSEVASQIFQEVVQVVTAPSDSEEEAHYDVDLRCSFVLSSISRYFRQVALGTPELWKRIEFRFSEFSFAKHAINGYALLFQHCVSHTSYLPLGLVLHFGFCSDIHKEQDIGLIREKLLSPDQIHRVKYLEVHRPPQWILSTSILSSFPMLDALCIDDQSIVNLSLRGLYLSRLSLRLPALQSITLSPSVRVLHLNGISHRVVLSIFRQSPKLVKFSTGHERSLENGHYSAPRHHPILNHLKRLNWSSPETLQTILNLRTPSLEHLNLNHFHLPDKRPVFISLFKQVSASLISLDLSSLRIFEYVGGLRKIFELSFPRLEELKLYFQSPAALLEPIKELIFQAESEKNIPEVKYLPSLRYLSLGSYSIQDLPSSFSRLLLDLLKQKRFGETSHFHLNFSVTLEEDEDQFWSLESREELRLIFYSRNLKLTRHNKRIAWL